MTRVRQWLREWWPALVISALAVISVEMLRSSFEAWQATLEAAVSGLDNVSESRRRLLRSYLVERHQTEGDPTFAGASSLAEAAAAEDALHDWFEGRGTLGGFRAVSPNDTRVIELGREYGGALSAFRAALAAQPGDPIERRRTFSVADRAASALQAAVHRDIRSVLRGEQWRYRLRLAAWGGFLLVTGIGLVVTRRAQRRAESERALAASRLSRLRAVAPVGIMECDAQGRVRASNVAWSRLTGLSEREWLGRPWWSALRPSERDQGRILWEESIRSGADQTAEFRLGTNEDDADLWVLVRTAPEAGELARADRWVITVTDVTARRQAEEQLRHAQRMEAVGRLAGGVAHDFNNLLTSIGGFAALARDSLPPGSEADDDLLEIQRGADRGRALTRQLLTFSRQDRIHPETVDIREVVREIERMLKRLVREDVELRVAVGESPALVLADRGQVEQVITNLVVNAGDALPQGGQIRISVSAVTVQESFQAAKSEIPAGRYALLSVSDTGTGIPPAIQARIFEPFFTTKERGKGTGLGLSTVWGIVRQSGGHIHLYSEEGRGTVFKIYIPAIETVAGGGGGPTRALAGTPDPRGTPATGASVPGQEGTILLVEDQEAVRRLAARILQLRGFRVLEAADGGEALEVLERHTGVIDLVITDVIMRGLGGPELIAELRARGHTTPALFMSGYSDSELPLGDVPFLEKPFSPDDLVRKVRDVLNT